MPEKERTRNDQRSDATNPHNPGHKAAADDRSSQLGEQAEK